jgi:hypothetical protein
MTHLVEHREFTAQPFHLPSLDGMLDQLVARTPAPAPLPEQAAVPAGARPDPFLTAYPRTP